MNRIRVSVAGADTLLGQHFLSRLARDPAVEVVSLHDAMGAAREVSLLDSRRWEVPVSVARAFAHVPLLPPGAPALAPLLLSFLPDEGAAGIEAAHLARGTRVVTHCEYARLRVPLAVPGITRIDAAAPHLATPNCTTAMCAAPLNCLHAVHGIEGVTITALQAISGTDLPGMQAHAIHDTVIGHLAGEADALSAELAALFGGAFPVDAFATRVPVWRGHTITLSVTLADGADAATVSESLSRAPGVRVAPLPMARDSFSPDDPLATVIGLRDGARGLLMVLKGDNLEAATTGLMQQVAHALG